MSNWFSDNDGHIVLIRSDGSVVYEDGYDPRRYCDIYYCYECPKYGDDCDGKEENMTEKKKSTSGEAPILRQDYGTTPEEKSEAEILFDKIGTGAYYAVRRPSNSRVDRQLRKLIANANMNGDCIINDGSGYFRPGEEDEDVFEAYCAAERHRGWEILHKINRMEEVFERRYQ